MKKLLTFAVALVAAYFLAGRGGLPGSTGVALPESAGEASEAAARAPGRVAEADGRALKEAFERRQGDMQVEGEGEVTRVLADDHDGYRHQRFILQLSTGQTVLIAHNIDLAPRVDGLRAGDRVAFFGEYEWNPQGGVVHWTHRDPAGQHVAGWLEVGGRRYQ